MSLDEWTKQVNLGLDEVRNRELARLKKILCLKISQANIVLQFTNNDVAYCILTRKYKQMVHDCTYCRSTNNSTFICDLCDNRRTHVVCVTTNLLDKNIPRTAWCCDCLVCIVGQLKQINYDKCVTYFMWLKHDLHDVAALIMMIYRSESSVCLF